MNLHVFKENTLFHAMKSFFAELNVPISEYTEHPAAPRDMAPTHFNENNPAHALIGDVYFLGMVDEYAFAGTKNPESPESIRNLNNDYDGLLIFGIELKERENGLMPSRSQLSEITRLFNREYNYTPVTIIFKYGEKLALANSEKLKYKQEWREGEKVGKVSLLRDIKISDPHTGHLKILKDLEIPTSGKNKVDNFAALYEYWQKVFNVSVLNKQFYNEIQKWYFWAVKEVKFPNPPNRFDFESYEKFDAAVIEHKSKNVIRLLTRILFIWFIKEKNLIPEQIFEEDFIKSKLLKDFTPQKPHGVFATGKENSMYYRAILQNLFFATLNQEMGKRNFRKDKAHRNVTNLMRYQNYFKEGGDKEFLKLMEEVVPFMNGGLFECLDKPHPTAKGRQGGDKIIYEDGFSDRIDNELEVPDYLFFDVDEDIDISNEMGSKNKVYKQSKTRGLLEILQSYKFTIAENTPVEEDVALDPELLGRVFENLLASYNPETKTTARKQTGSFYTPREIVNYMVDESLIAHLKNQIDDWQGYSEEEVNQKLHALLAFDDTINPFNEQPELQSHIIQALDKCKILDPACGSGAFPMGALQKMVHILHKVDANNTEWKQRQIERVNNAIEQLEEIDDANYREESIKDLEKQKGDIEEAFANNELDYGRKLYLIENCIYGVDIQSIAIQISKLRFFISLIVDQKIDTTKDNYGVRPLPNLETKFVAANTLIGIEKPDAQGILFEDTEVKKLEKQLKSIRHKLFSSKSPARKRELRAEDKKLRNQIAEKLQANGWGNHTARQLAEWDPYDQNDSSPFFDPEWMFDVNNGFDVIIANPPFVLLQEKIKNELDYLWIKKTFKVASYKVDLYHLFFEKGINLLSKEGSLTYITPTNFLLNNYTIELRRILLEANLYKILLLKNSAFEASVDTSIFSLTKNKKTATDFLKFNTGILDGNYLKILPKSSIKRYIFEKDNFNINPEFDLITTEILTQLEKGEKIKNIATVNFGMQLRNRNLFPEDVVQTRDKNHLSNFHKECYTGRDIKEYKVTFNNRYCFFNRDAKSGGCWDEKVQLSKNKILIPQIGKYPISGIDLKGFPVLNTAFLIVPEQKDNSFTLLAIINSKIIKYYWLKKFYDQRQTFPKIKGTYLKELPIPDDYSNYSLATISKIILFKTNISNSIIRHVLESLVFNLYFPTHMEKRGIDVIKYVEQDINKVMQGREFEELSEAEKEKVIEQLHQTWSNPDNEVVKRMEMFKEKSPDVLKVIMES